jgi:hypothetical protein
VGLAAPFRRLTVNPAIASLRYPTRCRGQFVDLVSNPYADTPKAADYTAAPHSDIIFHCASIVVYTVVYKTDHDDQAVSPSSRGLPLVCQCFTYAYVAGNVVDIEIVDSS